MRFVTPILGALIAGALALPASAQAALKFKAKPQDDANAPPASNQPLARQEQGAETGVRIGITVEPVGAALSAQLGLDDDRGILISDVVEGAAGEKAGLKRFDVIVAVNDEPVTSTDGLRGHLDGKKPGDVVSLKLRRGGDTLLVPVTLEARPASVAAAFGARVREELAARANADQTARARAYAERAAKGLAETKDEVARALLAEQGQVRSLLESQRASLEAAQANLRAMQEKLKTELSSKIQSTIEKTEQLTDAQREAIDRAVTEFRDELQAALQAGGNSLQSLPQLRFLTDRDGRLNAYLDSATGDAADAADAWMPQRMRIQQRENAANPASLNARLDKIESRMDKIEQLLEEIAAARKR